MKTTKYDASPTRLVLAGMATCPTVLGAVAAQWGDNGLFAAEWANMVGGWCVTYHEKYGKPPGRMLEQRFDRWAARQKDEKIVATVGRFIAYASDEHEQNADNADYIIDRAAELFETVALRRLGEDLTDNIDAGDVANARAMLDAYNTPNIGGTAFADVTNEEAWDLAFAANEPGIVRYSGSFGEFIGDELCRDALFAFMGPEKRGKTWWLTDVAIRGIMQHRRVAFFQVGDLSQNQFYRRLAIRFAKRPKKAKTIVIPTDLYPGGEVATETKEFDRGIKKEDAMRAVKAMAKKLGHDPYLRVSTHPNSSITAMGVRNILMEWARNGWVADVVVIDYADILADPGGSKDTRDGTNKNWQYMRRISQELHCLVVTGTQADAASYGKELITRSNFSEDKRKIAHVTGMVGLNQTHEEKANGVMRLNYLARREEYYNEMDVVYVAGCFDIGRPVMHSAFC